MNRVTLVRSMHHSVNNSHAAAVYAAMTGHDRGEQGGGARPTDHPSPGAVLGKLRPVADTSLPYVAAFRTKPRKEPVGRYNQGFFRALLVPATIRFGCLKIQMHHTFIYVILRARRNLTRENSGTITTPLATRSSFGATT